MKCDVRACHCHVSHAQIKPDEEIGCPHSKSEKCVRSLSRVTTLTSKSHSNQRLLPSIYNIIFLQYVNKIFEITETVGKPISINIPEL